MEGKKILGLGLGLGLTFSNFVSAGEFNGCDDEKDPTITCDQCENFKTEMSVEELKNNIENLQFMIKGLEDGVVDHIEMPIEEMIDSINELQKQLKVLELKKELENIDSNKEMNDLKKNDSKKELIWQIEITEVSDTLNQVEELREKSELKEAVKLLVNFIGENKSNYIAYNELGDLLGDNGFNQYKQVVLRKFMKENLSRTDAHDEHA